MQIVLHSDDMLLLQHWEDSIEVKCNIIDDIEKLIEIRNCLIIVNYSACSKHLKLLTKNNKVLVLHRTRDLQTAKYVLSEGAKGYGNALMRQHFIIAAVETIKESMIWLHPEFTTMLITAIPPRVNNLTPQSLDALSQREKEVALLLKDGSTYKEIAELLSITPRTVKAHSSQVYKKLFVKDRLGLALLLR